MILGRERSSDNFLQSHGCKIGLDPIYTRAINLSLAERALRWNFGGDHKFIAIKKSFVRDGKGTSLSIIGIYLAICLDKCPSTGQEAADERENNCYHFQLNEVI